MISRRRFSCGGVAACACLACGPAPSGATMPPVNPREHRANLEVDALHQFFTGWFTGQLQPHDAVFARFAGALAPEFEMITPSGVLRPRDVLIASLRGAHGVWGHDPGATIEIRAHRSTALPGGPYTLARYEEWQRLDGRWRGRLSTALLREAAGAPNGLEWVHVHETWMPEA